MMMSSSQTLHENTGSNVAFIYAAFLRLLAVFSLYAGIIYWAQITGLIEEPVLRFDLLPTNGRIVLTTLAVIMPFAALGLWMLASWGLVVWLIVATLEILMHTVWAPIYGESVLRVAFHVVSLLVMLILFSFILIERRRRRLRGH